MHKVELSSALHSMSWGTPKQRPHQSTWTIQQQLALPTTPSRSSGAWQWICIIFGWWTRSPWIIFEWCGQQDWKIWQTTSPSTTWWDTTRNSIHTTSVVRHSKNTGKGAFPEQYVRCVKSSNGGYQRRMSPLAQPSQYAQNMWASSAAWGLMVCNNAHHSQTTQNSHFLPAAESVIVHLGPHISRCLAMTKDDTRILSLSERFGIAFNKSSLVNCTC